MSVLLLLLSAAMIGWSSYEIAIDSPSKVIWFIILGVNVGNAMVGIITIAKE